MKRLLQHIQRAYLRMRIRSAEFDANVLQAEMLSGPRRLIRLRADITQMECRLHDLSVELSRLQDLRRLSRGG